MQVLDAYLVVKLHEAMFDMKEQLRMMEVQVAAIAKQKENLERMLQSKTQYIRVCSLHTCITSMYTKRVFVITYGGRGREEGDRRGQPPLFHTRFTSCDVSVYSGYGHYWIQKGYGRQGNQY